MAENSAIEWTDHTFNPWIGCTKVSPGCDHCYAEQRMDTRLHRVQWGAGAPRQRTKTWGDPKRWNAQHDAFFAKHGRRQRVFCASLADVFDNEVDPAWRADLFALIAATPELDWLLLTKRIGNWRALTTEALGAMVDNALGHWAQDWLGGHPPANIWIGATVVNQGEADRDIPKLLAVPAAVRFLSIEPMLGPIELMSRAWLADRLIDWVIVGGESGPKARPMHPDWARSLRDQCSAAGVPFMFKQHGEWRPWEPAYAGQVLHVSARDGTTGDAPGFQARSDTLPVVRIGKKAAGRLLDGIEHNGFPGA